MRVSACSNCAASDAGRRSMSCFEASAVCMSFLGMTWAAPSLEIVLPLGVSFYTFQSMSYTIDVFPPRTSNSVGVLGQSITVAAGSGYDVVLPDVTQQ